MVCMFLKIKFFNYTIIIIIQRAAQPILKIEIRNKIEVIFSDQKSDFETDLVEQLQK